MTIEYRASPHGSVEDPSFRAVGVIAIDGDEAEVKSVPDSVELGVSDELLQSFEDMGERLRELEAQPARKEAVIGAFVDDWDAGRVERAIIARVEAARHQGH